MRCLEERKLIEMSVAIRQKPEWWTKYKNPTIAAKWRKEMQGYEVREDIINFLFSELEYYDDIRKSTGGTFQTGPNDYVFVGDGIVPSELKQQLRKGVALLEDVPDHMKDWHPGSDDQVLDLVHPSLYPYQYNITPRLPDTESVGLVATYSGGITPTIAPEFDKTKDIIKKHVEPYGISSRFQWLPSVFNVSETGHVTIKSYINNLHPIQHQNLYQPIADIFSRAIPGLNACLSRYASPEYLRCDPFDNVDGLYADEVPNFEDASDEDEAYFAFMESRVPAPVKFEWTGPPENDVTFDVKGRNLKVITKLANIHLTPEKPDYKGGSWHVEGQINEDIVATVLYYYHSENITTSNLAFRIALRDPSYEQGDENGVRTIFGLTDDDKMQADAGAVEAIEDRIVVFPNIMQHRVAPFSLADKTKPGHRKILCFFITDPFNDRVVTTDQVPPQQAQWWIDSVLTEESNLTRKLPTELINSVMEKVEWPMPMSEAKKVREELMKERSLNHSESVDSDTDGAFGRNFSLCEH